MSKTLKKALLQKVQSAINRKYEEIQALESELNELQAERDAERQAILNENDLVADFDQMSAEFDEDAHMQELEE